MERTSSGMMGKGSVSHNTRTFSAKNVDKERSDRKIDNYYEKIRQSKQEKLFHEVILQIGNKDDTNPKVKKGSLQKKY